jgi:membrane protein implicated in regulation of membrane protease activity
MSFVDLDFYLVFLGISALLVGLASIARFGMPFWVEWLVFSGLSVGSLVFFRKRVYSKLRPPPESEIREGVEGDRATAVDEIAPAARGAVTLRGTSWTGLNVGGEAIPAGALCLVVRSEGLLLELRLE